jgi:Fe-S-cluster containining protein
MRHDGDLDCDITLCKAMCCRNCPVLTEKELVDLLIAIKKEYDLELDQQKYFRKAKGEHGLYFAMKMIKGQCIFLTKETRCRIYRCRPKLCELYPAIDFNTVDPKCPDIMKNKLTPETLTILKQRYAVEIDERIKKEQTFRFI